MKKGRREEKRKEGGIKEGGRKKGRREEKRKEGGKN